MKKKITLTFLLIFSFAYSYACSCETNGNFKKVSKHSNLVALVKINKYLTFDSSYNRSIPMSMEVEIVEILKGKSESKRVVVWGDNGMLCRPYVSNFIEGEYYFMALDSGDEFNYGGHKEEKISDYSISICGEYWMHANIDTKRAQSEVSGKTKNIPFKKIYSYFK